MYIQAFVWCSSSSVDNADIQESKPVPTAPVDIPVGKGGCDAKTESGKDAASVTVDKPDVDTTTAHSESAAAHTADEDDDRTGGSLHLPELTRFPRLVPVRQFSSLLFGACVRHLFSG